MAVLMPIRLPWLSTSAPPELPGLIAASVWMKFSKVLIPRCERPERRDDAHGHRLTDAEGIADGQGDVADHDVVHLPEGDRRQGPAPCRCAR
jgi:hypothetical protein